MVTDTMPQFPTARDDVLLRRVGSEWVLFDERRSRAHVLNLTAAVIWTYCDGLHGPAAIAETITREVQGAQPDSVRTDIERILKRFSDEGLFR